MGILEKKKKKKDVITSHKKTAMLTLLCKLSNINNKNLAAYQKQFGFLLRTSRATKKTTNNLSRLHDTVAYSTLTKIMKKFSKRNDADVRAWKSVETIHCGDNLDVRSQVSFEGDG